MPRVAKRKTYIRSTETDDVQQEEAEMPIANTTAISEQVESMEKESLTKKDKRLIKKMEFLSSI